MSENPSIKEIFRILRDAFPKAHFERAKHEIFCHIQCQTPRDEQPSMHTITINPTIDLQTGDAFTKLILSWEEARGGDADSSFGLILKDSLTTDNLNDVMGWVSLVRGQIIGIDEATPMPGKVQMPYLTQLCWEHPVSTYGGKVPPPFTKIKLTTATYRHGSTNYTMRLLRPGDYKDAGVLFWQGIVEKPVLAIPKGVVWDIEHEAHKILKTFRKP